MSLSIMIKNLRLNLSLALLLSLVTGQQSIFWEVADPIVNSDFIEAYINRLIEADKFEENTIQASFYNLTFIFYYKGSTNSLHDYYTFFRLAF